jgi:hypothetical protein
MRRASSVQDWWVHHLNHIKSQAARLGLTHWAPRLADGCWSFGQQSLNSYLKGSFSSHICSLKSLLLTRVLVPHWPALCSTSTCKQMIGKRVKISMIAWTNPDSSLGTSRGGVTCPEWATIVSVTSWGSEKVGKRKGWELGICQHFRTRGGGREG